MGFCQPLLEEAQGLSLSLSFFWGEGEIEESLLLGGSNKGEASKRWYHICSVSIITEKRSGW